MSQVIRPLLYLKGVITSLIFYIYTAVLCVLFILLGLLTFRNTKVLDFILFDLWAKVSLWILGIRVHVRGAENVPQTKEGFLLLFNHTSQTDIILLFGYFPRSFRFGAKIELFKIPLFGWCMQVAGVLPIDRSQREHVLKVYEAAIPRLKNGECFALAPEGTRQSGAHIGPFKTGPFLFALQAQVPLVPVVLHGAQATNPKGSPFFNTDRWWSSVTMEIGPTYSTNGLKASDMDRLQQGIRQWMVSAFEVSSGSQLETKQASSVPL